MKTIIRRLRKMATSLVDYKVTSEIIYVDDYYDQDLGITLNGTDLLNMDPNKAYKLLYDEGMAYDSGEIFIPAGSMIHKENESDYECTVTLPNGSVAIMDLDLYDVSSLLQKL